MTANVTVWTNDLVDMEYLSSTHLTGAGMFCPNSAITPLLPIYRSPTVAHWKQLSIGVQ